MRNLRLGAILGAWLGLGACDGTDEGGACREDFDCDVGQVCSIASGEEEGACVAAGPGETRSFGAVELSFAGGGEAYLVSLVSIPAGAEATTTSEAEFTLQGAAGLSALRLAAAAPAADPFVARRIELESARHERIAAIAARAAARPAARTSALTVGQSTCGECGATQMCWEGSCTAAPALTFVRPGNTVSMDLIGVVDAGTTRVNVLLDTMSAAAHDQALAAVEQFALGLAHELELLGLANGHGGSLDRDGDGRFTVAFTNAVEGSIDLDVVGFFDVNDFGDAEDPEATGNQADILWVRVPGTVNGAGEITAPLAIGTMVHEYVHLASFALRVQARPGDAVQEVRWLDEGLAHLMEDLTGWGGSNIDYVAAAFGGWNTTTFASQDDSELQRGKSFLLLRHLLEQSGRAPGAVIGELLTEPATGLEHPLIAAAAGESLWRWQLATYATGNPAVTEDAAHAYDFDPVTSSATGYLVGVDSFGTYPNARGGETLLDGPEVADILDPAGDLVDSIPDSGSMLFVVSGGSGAVTLRGRGPADVDLRLAAQRIQ